MGRIEGRWREGGVWVGGRDGGERKGSKNSDREMKTTTKL